MKAVGQVHDRPHLAGRAVAARTAATSPTSRGNLFIGVNNAFALDQPGSGVDVRDGSVVPLPDLAKAYKDAGIYWVAIGDENYGEGSSREHAAMEPRYMNGRAVIVRSFARIHEANLKKQGVLALTFANPDDYERIRVDDTVDIVGLAELAPGHPVEVVVHHADGTTDEITHHAHDVRRAHRLVPRRLRPQRPPGELTPASVASSAWRPTYHGPYPVVVLAVCDDPRRRAPRPNRSIQYSRTASTIGRIRSADGRSNTRRSSLTDDGVPPRARHAGTSGPAAAASACTAKAFSDTPLSAAWCGGRRATRRHAEVDDSGGHGPTIRLGAL